MRARPSKKSIVATTATLVIAAVAIVVAVSLGVIGGSQAPPETHKFVIPEGASERAKTSGELNGIPQLIEATEGDKLVITNNDERLQIIAGYPIESGDTVEIPLNRAGRYETACSVHKDKSITLVVAER